MEDLFNSVADHVLRVQPELYRSEAEIPPQIVAQLLRDGDLMPE